MISWNFWKLKWFVRWLKSANVKKTHNTTIKLKTVVLRVFWTLALVGHRRFWTPVAPRCKKKTRDVTWTHIVAITLYDWLYWIYIQWSQSYWVHLCSYGDSHFVWLNVIGQDQEYHRSFVGVTVVAPNVTKLLLNILCFGITELNILRERNVNKYNYDLRGY